MGKAAHISLCDIRLLKAELILVQLIIALPDRLKIEKTLKADAGCNADVKHMHQKSIGWYRPNYAQGHGIYSILKLPHHGRIRQ